MSSEFRVRTLSAIVYASLVFFASLYSSWAIILFLLIVGLFCLYEYQAITAMKKSGFIGVLILSCLILLSLYFNWLAPKFILYVLVGFTLIYSLLKLLDLFNVVSLPLHKEWKTRSFEDIMMMFALLILSIHSFDTFTLILPYFILTWVSDVGAYLVGRQWGKTPLYKAVSPKKTIEGSLGAGFFTLLCGFIFWKLFFTYTLAFWLCFALVIWLFSSLGDLVESKFKRQYSIKDSSQLIPGHGGFLDRFDGFYFAIPWFILLLLVFKII